MKSMSMVASIADCPETLDEARSLIRDLSERLNRHYQEEKRLIDQTFLARQEAATLRGHADALAEAIEHYRHCRTCAEDGESGCVRGGQEALAALKAYRASEYASP